LTAETKEFSSSLVSSATFDPDSQELTVVTTKGREYTIDGFSPQDWDAFKGAWSPGRFFNERIRGKY
jgi:KTSC domain